MIVASFWVLRPEEHPEAAARNYPGMLKVLQRSCDRLKLRHIVLTDERTASSQEWPEGIEARVTWLPEPLMRAATEAHARYLESSPDTDTLFVGADCIVLRDPSEFYPSQADFCVTYRGRKSGMPINTGTMFIRKEAAEDVALFFRAVADRCGTRWCDDQRSLCFALMPLPLEHGVVVRKGLSVGFVPLDPLFNVIPNAPEEEHLDACVLHFKGKSRKQLFFDWAKHHGYA